MVVAINTCKERLEGNSDTSLAQHNVQTVRLNRGGLTTSRLESEFQTSLLRPAAAPVARLGCFLFVCIFFTDVMTFQTLCYFIKGVWELQPEKS